MASIENSLVQRALNRDSNAVRALVAALQPVVHFAVARALFARAGQGATRDPRQEVEDVVQEVFGALFADEARALRAWRPEGGRSLESFVAFFARFQTLSLLRSGKRSPWTEDPTELAVFDEAPADETPLESLIAQRDFLNVLLERIAVRFSARSQLLFQRLYVDEAPVEDVGRELGLSRHALYQWRHRFAAEVRTLALALQDELGLATASG